MDKLFEDAAPILNKMFEDASDMFEKMFDEEGEVRESEPDFPLGNMGDMPGDSF